jgi:rhodanese-related sulfurtransferase
MSLQTATISPSELRAHPDLGTKVRLLDVRTPGEFAGARIAGSHNVPLPDLADHAGALVSGPATDLVVVCQTGGRARQAAEVLRAAGHPAVAVLEGGVAGWQAQGGEVEREKETWALERQVRLVAGSLVAGSILASLRVPAARFLAGAVGSGLVFAAVSNTCMMGNLLARLPYNRAASTDVAEAVAALTA